MDAHKLTGNPLKSKCIIVNPKLRHPQTRLSLFYNNTQINCRNSLKYLGVELVNKLNFLPHFSTIESKLSRNVGILAKLKHCLPTTALLTLYYAFIYPHILYGIALWGFAYSSHLNKLQVVQNKTVRAICSLNWREHLTPYFFRCNILKIKDVAKLETAKFMHTFTNQILQKYFLAYFRRVSVTHNRRTRSCTSDKLNLPLFKTNRAQTSIKYQPNTNINEEVRSKIRAEKLETRATPKRVWIGRMHSASVAFS